MSQRIFVYGSLKRGCSNHAQLAGQTFIAEARTAPGYRMVDAGGFPGLVLDGRAGEGIVGEIWAVDSACLLALDRFEGLHEGLYRREPIRLAAPFESASIDAYFYGRDAAGLRDAGTNWRE